MRGTCTTARPTSSSSARACSDNLRTPCPPGQNGRLRRAVLRRGALVRCCMLSDVPQSLVLLGLVGKLAYPGACSFFL